MTQPPQPPQSPAPQQPPANQSFSRPGAIDLSGLSAQSGAPASSASGAYVDNVTEQNLQQLLESSMSAPVVLVVSSSRSPESIQVADDLQALTNEFDGKIFLGRIDADSQPQLVQALQVTGVPTVFLVAQGRPMPLLQQAASREELRTVLEQVLQQLAQGGFTGRHQPRSGVVDEETGEEVLDPRYAPAQEALARNDIDTAISEYQKLIDSNPADVEAQAGLAMAKVLKRTQDVDLNQAREAAAARPDDVDAQIMVADLDLIGGHVDDAFNRLIDVVRRSSDEDRNRARLHAIELFDAVGNDDERVQRARRNLASALF